MKKKIITLIVLVVIGFIAYFTYEKCFCCQAEDTCKKDTVAVCTAKVDTISAVTTSTESVKDTTKK